MKIKKLLIMSSFIFLILMLGFAQTPAKVAHADSCTGNCGQDPVVAGCWANQSIVKARDFYIQAQNETWEIRLRSSNVRTSACIGQAWASIVLVSGSNPTLYNSVDIQVYVSDPGPSDILNSSQFGSGGYTNMLPYARGDTCAQYDGNGMHQYACDF